MSDTPRILGINVHSAYRGDDFLSAVDRWRVSAPLNMLKKQGWEVDVVNKWLPFENLEDVDTIEGRAALEKIANEYDIIYSSYQQEPWAATIVDWMKAERGMKYVMDIDDNIFKVTEHNPAARTLIEVNHKSFGVPLRNIDIIRAIIESEPYMTVATKPLASQVRRMRKKRWDSSSVKVMPNLIDTEYYDHPEFDNGKNIVIGWFGSSHHQGDLENTGFLLAVQMILEKYRRAEFHICGFDAPKSMPKGQVKVYEPDGDSSKFREIWRQMNFDIGCAPLEDHDFNKGKSNIKWQEYALMGAAPVLSQSYSYRKDAVDNETAVLTANSTDDWFLALEKLVRDKELRQSIANTARYEVEEKWSLQKNWQQYADYFKEVHGQG